MPWNERSSMSLRTEFVLFASQPGANIRALCRLFGITPNTAYKWLNRFRDEGFSGLVEHSRKPIHSPAATDSQTVELILNAVRNDPYHWRARKIKNLLEQQGHTLPSVSTVHAIMHRHFPDLRAHTPSSPAYTRFEHEAPNQLWQMDFKGHFAWNGGRSHPLTVLDDHSRFALCLRHCRNEQRETVMAQLVRVFERYGVPERMTMDNGSPWGDKPGSWTQLELELMKQGIRVTHSTPGHPQTQGKLERFHRSLKAELLQGNRFVSEKDIQRKFDTWRDVYNQQRPHEALSQNVPASRYMPSAKQYEPSPKAAEYDEGVLVRKVDSDGYFCLKGVSLKAGKAFRGEYIGLKASDDGEYKVWWYSHVVGKIDLKNGSIRMGKQC